MRTRLLVVVGLLTTCIGRSVAADDARPTAEEYERRIEQLEKDVEELKRSRPETEPAVAPADSTAKPVAGYNDGFFIQSPDGNFRLNPSVWTHFDSRFFLDKGDKGTTEFVFRRVRLDVRATVLKYFEGRVMTDFSGGRTTLFDAYLNVTYFDFARPQVGKYKVPVGLERLRLTGATGSIGKLLRC